MHQAQVLHIKFLHPLSFKIIIQFWIATHVYGIIHIQTKKQNINNLLSVVESGLTLSPIESNTLEMDINSYVPYSRILFQSI